MIKPEILQAMATSLDTAKATLLRVAAGHEPNPGAALTAVSQTLSEIGTILTMENAE